MDDDYALALQLQSEFFDNNESDLQKEIGIKVGEPKSLVDPFWELTDPNPDIRALFLQFNERFFWGRLAGIEIRWSPRMTLCAGLCCYEGRGGLCSVRLSVPLLKLRPRKDLVETLLHEMIHAYLFVTDNNKDHDGHGPEFHKHMYRINKEAGTSISVYHNFHDEVDLYKQHWWRCDGPCRSRKPYFGYVKRSMNRAPSKNDTWWAEHQRTCGGTYTKVKEPENYGKKKGNPKSEDDKKKDKGKSSVKSMDIRVFAGVGKTLGGNKVDTVSATKSVADDYTATPKPSTSQIVPADKSSDSNTSRFGSKDVSDKGSPSQGNALPGGKTPQKNPVFKNIPISQGGNARFNEKRKIVFNIPDFSDSDEEDDDRIASISLDNLSADSVDDYRDSDKFCDSKEHISKSDTNDFSNHVSETEAFEAENNSSEKNNSQFAQNGLTVNSSCSNEADDVRAMLRKVWGQKQFNNKVSGSKIAKGKTMLPLNSFDSSESLVGKVKTVDNNTDRKYPGTDRNSVIGSNKRISDTSLDITPPLKRPRSVDKALATGASENTDKVKMKTMVTSLIDKYFKKSSSVNSPAGNLPETSASYSSSQFVNPAEGDNSCDTKTNGKIETSACPICNTPVPVSTINDHLDLCLTLQAI